MPRPDPGPTTDPGLLAWFHQPPPGRGLRFAEDDGEGWNLLAYETLARRVRRAAWRLGTSGVEAGSVVPLVCPASPEFVATFFGALVLGATPCPVAPRTAFSSQAAHEEHVMRVVRLVGARVLVTTSRNAPALAAPAAKLRCTVLSEIDSGQGSYAGPVRLPELALVQFSSGSTGPQRGIQVSLRSLLANVGAIHHWLSYTVDDGFATWLPPHHDMGLVGGLLTPMAAGADIWVMRPEQFIRSPLRWLRLFSGDGVTTTTTPAFGLALLLRRVRPHDLAGMDFRGWRTLIVGAEPIPAGVLEATVELLAPHGFDYRVLMPAYGLAEATLAVTGKPRGRPVRTLAVDVSSLRLGEPVRHRVNASRLVVGCGSPIAGAQTEIVGADGRPVEPGVLGEIVIGGVSLAAGCIADSGEIRFGDRIHTGDAGFVHEGELYILGRLGDSAKHHGRWLFAEELQQVAIGLSPRPHKVVVLLGTLAGSTTAVVAVENAGRREPEATVAAERVGRAVLHHAMGVRVLVLAVPPGWILRTTSGKPRRRVMWQRVVAGQHAGAVRWDSQGVAA